MTKIVFRLRAIYISLLLKNSFRTISFYPLVYKHVAYKIKLNATLNFRSHEQGIFGL